MILLLCRLKGKLRKLLSYFGSAFAPALLRLLFGLPAAFGASLSDLIGRGEGSDFFWGDDGVLEDLAIDLILWILSDIARGVGVSWVSAVPKKYIYQIGGLATCRR